MTVPASTSSVVYGNARFIAKAGQADQLAAALDNVVTQARQEPGNVRLAGFRSANQPAIIYLHSAWRDRDALSSHFAQPYVTEFLATAPAIEAEPNVVGFGHRVTDLAQHGQGAEEGDVHGTGRVVAKRGHETELEQALVDLAHELRARPANIELDVYRSDDQPALFYLVESWHGDSPGWHSGTEQIAQHPAALLRSLLAEPFTAAYGPAMRTGWQYSPDHLSASRPPELEAESRQS